MIMAVIGSAVFVISASALLWRSCSGTLAEEVTIDRRESAGNVSKQFDELLKNYDKRDRPFIGQKGTEVKISFGVVSFSAFKEADMEFKTQVHIRQVWTDPRLAQNYNVSLSLHLKEDIERLWLPDLYLANAKKVDQENMWLGIISPSGQIYFSYLATVTLGCKMDFVDYPMDQQICPIYIESYGHIATQVTYEWYQKDSVTVFDKNLAEFEITRVDEIQPVTVMYMSGPYRQLAVKFTFTRRMGYYLLQIYIPCILIVTSSWTIFWMEPSSVTDRAALGVSSVLSIVFLLGTSNSTMPRVSYIKAIDWFMIISFVFVFLTVIECVVVYKIEEKKKRAKESPVHKEGVLSSVFKVCLSLLRVGSELQTTEEKHVVEDNASRDAEIEPRADTLILQNFSNRTDLQADTEGTDPTQDRHFTNCETFEVKKCRVNVSLFIDRLCRVLFPLSYILFNIGYWVVYLQARWS